ncbi:hypothetical protein VNI00_013782 [Paramarasmius palmivorus]|uniref:Uncharacterized protein n=1 Tax=Paramarasmius palmivorus TaxID=297713 RepID=A0AAW0BVW3_9AGAR
MPYLSVNDLISYSKVNKAVHTAVQAFHKRSFRVENVLSPYLNAQDTRSFRILQYTFGVLIGGSTALAFFQRFAYPESDLDLYVNIQYVAILGLFLEDAGYRYTPARFDADGTGATQAENLTDAIETVFQRLRGRGLTRTRAELYDLKGMVGVFTFIRADGQKIEVIDSEAVVMNLIGYTHAISLYPKSTFIERASLKLEVKTRKAEDACVKYESRGWSMISPGAINATSVVAQTTDLHIYPRHINDEYCWRVPLDPVENFAPPVGYMDLGVDSMFLQQSWRLHYESQSIARMVQRQVPYGQWDQRHCLCTEVEELLTNISRDISDLTEKLKEWYKTLFEPDSSSSRAKDCLLRALEQMKSQHPNLATHWLSSASAARILHASIQAFYSVEESEDVNVTVCAIETNP